MQQRVSGELDAARLVQLACTTLAQAAQPAPRLVVVEGFSSSALPRVEVGAQKEPAPPDGQVLARLALGFGEHDLDALTDVVAAWLAAGDGRRDIH